jgi:dolichyl-phosphate beta-glucosyltransferase
MIGQAGREAARQIAAEREQMAHVSLIFPAYNEEARIARSLRSAAGFVEQADLDADIIVVDDGSADGTVGVVRQLQEEYGFIRLMEHERNQGKGFAVRTGVLAAEGEFSLFCDVDEAVPIREVTNLLSAAIEQDADVTIGTRYHRDSVIVKRQPWQRILVSRLGNLLIRALLLPGLRDTQCGFKLFRQETMRPVLEQVTVSGFGFDLEVLAIARSWRLRTIEVPVTWEHGEGSSLRLAPAAISVLRDLLGITWRIRTGQYPPPAPNSDTE